MSREIMFRLWDGRKEEYVNLANKEFEFTPDSKEPWILAFGFGKRFIVEQYTGLKDKNGKKIYEGDVVEVNTKKSGRDTCEVLWNESIPGFEMMSFDGEIYSFFDIGVDYEWESIEVIGNIHENPELLEDKNE